MVTLREILRLQVLRGARVVAGRKGLSVPVRWCHSSDVLDIARLLSGGELLLTTGLSLDVPPEQQVAYVRTLRERGVAGLMLELERKFHTVPQALAEAADRAGLPLITLPFDTPFVKVTEAVHALVLAEKSAGGATGAELRAGQRLVADLLTGRAVEAADLKRRLEEAGRACPGQPWLAVLVADQQVDPEALQAAAAAELGPESWLVGKGSGETRLVAFASDRSALASNLWTLALRLAPAVAGVGRCYADPRGAPDSLAEARQTMRLRRLRPALAPLFAETGIYQLIPGRGSEEMHGFVTEWLGPLLQYDRVHKSDLCETLRQLLDDRLAVARAAGNLHLTRQGLYHRQQRITEVLGRNLDDPEVRVALAVALRFWDVVASEQPESGLRPERR